MPLIEIEVLSDELNHAVVRMPGRRFPGVVIQSDKLINLHHHAKRLHEAAKATGDSAMISSSSTLAFETEQFLRILNEASSGPNSQD